VFISGYVGFIGRTWRPDELQLRLGGLLFADPDPDAVYVNISHVIPHPAYHVLKDDIGLIRVAEPIEYTDTILPICLPSPNVTLDQFKVCVVTGFGKISVSGLCYFSVAFVDC